VVGVFSVQSARQDRLNAQGEQVNKIFSRPSPPLAAFPDWIIEGWEYNGTGCV
jgi:hypothetical protein